MLALRGGNMLFRASALLSSCYLSFKLLQVIKLLEMLLSSILVFKEREIHLSFTWSNYNAL